MNDTVPPVFTTILPNVTRIVSSNLGFVAGDPVLNSPIARLILQAIIIITLARTLGYLFSFLKEPLVIAEMIAGILLGPTVMGRIPNFTKEIFPPESIPLLQIASQVGLLLFMFVVGLELDTKLLRTRLKSAVFASVLGVIIPLIFAVPLIWLFYTDEFLGFHHPSKGSFYLFIGIVLSISALPVLARIISEYQFLNSSLGVFTMTATTVDDMIAWPLLALAIALAGAKKSITVLYIILLLLGDVALIFVFLWPAYWLIARFAAQRGITQNTLFLCVLVMLVMSFFCEISGMTYLVGAFQAGVMVPRKNGLASGIAQRIEHIAVVIFMPLFFAVSGLRTQFAVLDSGKVWGYTFLLTGISLLGRALGGIPCARLLAKLSWRDSIAFAILMNTKGLVALVTINLGLEYDIISEKFFAMMLIMVLLNTCMTGPLIALLDFIIPAPPPDVAQNDLAVLCTHGTDPVAPTALVNVATLLSTPEHKCDLLLFQILDAEEPSVYINPTRREKSTAAVKALAKHRGVNLTTRFEATSNPLVHLRSTIQDATFVFAIAPYRALGADFVSALRESGRALIVLLEADADAANVHVSGNRELPISLPANSLPSAESAQQELPIPPPQKNIAASAPAARASILKPKRSQVRLLMPVPHGRFETARAVLDIVLRMVEHHSTEEVQLVFVTIAPRNLVEAVRDHNIALTRILSSRGVEAVWRETDAPTDPHALLDEITTQQPTHLVLPMDDILEGWVEVIQAPPVPVLLVRPELAKEKDRDLPPSELL